MSSYGSDRSTVKHCTDSCCRIKHDRLINKLNFNEIIKRRKCKFCYPKRGEKICFICTENCDDIFGENECHSICIHCIQDHINILSRNIYWDQIVKCPCNSGITLEIPKDMIPTKNYVSSNTSFKKCIIDEGLNFVCNLKCPNCHSVYYDFDACCAIRCECEIYFCAFCEQLFNESKKCHEHVTNCEKNPLPGELYVPLELWRQQQTNQKKIKLIKFIKSVANEVSLLHLGAIIYAISRQGVHLLNNHSKIGISVIILFILHQISHSILFLLTYSSITFTIWSIF